MQLSQNNLDVPEEEETQKRRGSAPATSVLKQTTPLNTPEPRRKSDSDDTLKEPSNSRSQKLIEKYRHSVDVSADILRTIEEVCKFLKKLSFIKNVTLIFHG